MPRRRVIAKREIIPDPIYGSKLLAKFMNHLMKDGKKSIAEGIVYGALDIIKDKLKADPVEAFGEAIKNIKPKVEVKSRRVGGATYQVPVEVHSDRALTLAIRWIIEAARKRSKDSMVIKLSAEILDALEGKGSAVKKREDTHKMAEANKAFSHFNR